jgi:uncharacterized membrane protein (DUF441 family)
MKKRITFVLKISLLVFVASYVFLPNLIDSKYGSLVAVATVLLIAWMAGDGVSAAKKITRRND